MHLHLNCFFVMLPCILLQLLVLVMAPNDATADKCQNGQHCDEATTTTWEQVELVAEDGTRISLRKDKQVLGEGSYFTEVFEAEVLDGRGPQLRNKRVALKYSLVEDTAAGGDEERLSKLRKQKRFQQNEWRIFDLLQRTLSTEQLERSVIQVYARGLEVEGAQTKMFVVMELGAKEFLHYVNTRADEWLQEPEEPVDDEELLQIIAEPTAAIRDLHKVVVHMDVKPENFINVRQADGKFTLKALDFGGSVPIGEGTRYSKKQKQQQKTQKDLQPQQHQFQSNNPPLGSNAKTRVYHLITTEAYECPESTLDLTDARGEIYVEVTPKCDVWSLGMVLFECALKDPRLGLFTADKDETFQLVKKANGMFIGAVVEEWSAQSREPELMDNFGHYFPVLHKLLAIRLYFPRTFILLMAALDPLARKRPTAEAMLDFIGHKCRLSAQQQDAVHSMQILPGIKIAELRKMVGARLVGAKRAKNGGKSTKKGRRVSESAADLAEILELMERGDAPVAEALQETEKLPLCDTGSGAIEQHRKAPKPAARTPAEETSTSELARYQKAGLIPSSDDKL